MRVLSPSSSDVPTLTSLRNVSTTTGDSDRGVDAKSIEKPILAPGPTVPTVVLDTDVVSDTMAARLCISFLSHVLFLKNQIPFPIVQLARMPTSDNTTRAAKKRQELLNSFDTLASHLYTTFIALSTALALRGSPEKAKWGTETLCRPQTHGVSRAFFAIVLGPTVGSAKSRVIVGIDGLETKVWGLREDNIADTTDDGSEEEEDENSLEEESDSEEDSPSGDEESGSDNEETDASGSDRAASPPPSRSPSPAPSSDSDASLPTSPRNAPPRASLGRTEDPDAIRAAERLLSRTLAGACAEDDGHGLASEMAPTQIHVLLRAPRRFDHPSWVPRQNLSTSMDGHVADFLAESGETSVSRDTLSKKRARTSKIQGVWVKSRANGIQIDVSPEGNDVAEEDELIWWSWDGKLVGFADW